MDLQTLKIFFMWCTILNGALLMFWSLMTLLAMDWIYRLQSRWFAMPKETFNVVMYVFLGLFKIYVLALNLVPYVVLVIMT